MTKKNWNMQQWY